MIDPELILRQLMIDGHEGASLLAAFGRWVRALDLIGEQPALKSSLQKVQSADPAPAVDRSATRANLAQVATAPPLSVSITAPPDNAKAIARKAIAQSMLSPSAIAVGSHLVERFNLTTGRCDPGFNSICTDLGISRRTAMRSVTSLVEAGLFGRVRHGGRGHANAYQPNWPLLVERAAEGDVGTVTRLTVEGANVGTQNHLIKPDSDSMVGKAQRRRPQSQPDLRQRYLPLSFSGGRDKAEAAVRAKLNGQLNAHLTPLGKPVFVEGLTRSMAVDWSAAIAAEMRKAGDGLLVLLAAIDAVGGQQKIGLGGSGR